jgi:hypothetical protein
MTLLKAAVLLLLLSSLPLRAQDEPAVVKLTVKHDGQKKAAPASVTLRFGSQSVEVPVRDGKFEAPPEAVKAEKVTFATNVEGDHIEIPGIAGGFLLEEDWTLLLAERRYDESTQSGVPKGANIRRSCVLVFESVHTDPGQSVFVTPCRSKRRP